MMESPGILFTIASFAFVIGLLVFIHEFGHYFAGRIFGVKADAFSIGFGKELFGWTDKRGTRWRIAALPLGGYVKFAGDIGPSSQTDESWKALPPAERERTFAAKPTWQRAIIVAAGPVTNFLFAIIVFAVFFSTYGQMRTPPVVAQIAENSAAAAAGFKVGDRVLEVRGEAIDRFEDIRRIVVIRPDEPLTVVVERGGHAVSLQATPKADVQMDRFGNQYRQGLLGIGPGKPTVAELTIPEALAASVRHTRELVGMIIDTTSQIITGRRSMQELGGPLKIAQFSGQQAAMGLPDLIEFMALISINLGFINLLPVPMLDGGHLLFYGIEAVRRRPVGARVQEWAFRSGLALLATLMLLVTVNDLGSFGLWTGLGRLLS